MNYLQEVNSLIERQMLDWDTVRKHYDDLVQAKVRFLKLGASTVVLQFNPERLRSTAARVDAASIKTRACFLCSENQPQEQQAVLWQGRYRIQVNPYPIFPRHLTVASVVHTPQRIAGCVDDLLQLSHDLPGFVLFYNGPKCGASAPDHAHFQAGSQGIMPFCQEVFESRLMHIVKTTDGYLALSEGMARRAFIISATTQECATEFFTALQRAMSLLHDEDEPMQNVLCWHVDGVYHMIVFPRRKHRPACYGSEEGRFMVSPASVDMGGLWTVPVEKDFKALTGSDVQSIFDEVCLTHDEALKIVKNINKKYNE